MCREQKITQVNCPDKDRVEPESTPGVRSILLRATDRKDCADFIIQMGYDDIFIRYNELHSSY